MLKLSEEFAKPENMAAIEARGKLHKEYERLYGKPFRPDVWKFNSIREIGEELERLVAEKLKEEQR